MSSGFLIRHQEAICELVRLSQAVGARADYVQGGGGNTSCKLDDRYMAIKASGYRLDQMEAKAGYAVLDFAALSSFFQNTDASQLADIEAAGAAQTRAAVLPVEGLPVVRPSVEAGFHSVLDRFVLHSHAVYANLACCVAHGESVVAQALADLPETFVYIPYVDPGSQLTFAIEQARRRALEQTGTAPAIYFLQNHGLIVTGADVDSCLLLHEDVNRRIAAAFGTGESAWPDVAIAPVRSLADASLESEGETIAAHNRWRSDTAWLARRLRDPDLDIGIFEEAPLYPDQLVFLNGQLTTAEKGGLLDWLNQRNESTHAAVIFRTTGEVLYTCSEAQARTIEQTLCAILFLHETLREAGWRVHAMNEAGQAFITGWESEQYRKNIGRN